MLLEDGRALDLKAVQEAMTKSSAQQTATGLPDFAELIDCYQTKVHRLVAGILGPEFAGDAEDATQEVFLQVYRKLRAFRGESAFATWLYRLAYNRAVDYRRGLVRRKKPLSTSDPDLGNANEAGPLSTMLQHERNLELLRCVDRLSKRQKLAVRLHYWLGCSVAEVAELTGSRPSTVKSHLFRARKALAMSLERKPT